MWCGSGWRRAGARRVEMPDGYVKMLFLPTEFIQGPHRPKWSSLREKEKGEDIFFLITVATPSAFAILSLRHSRLAVRGRGIQT